MIFLDPPFNLGKKYGKNGRHDDRKKETEYVDYMEKVLGKKFYDQCFQ